MPGDATRNLRWHAARLVFLLKCFGILAFARALLAFTQYRTIRRVIIRAPATWDAPQEYGRNIAWGIEAASRFVPDPTCLARALAGQAMLSWRGYASQIKIGVAKEDGAFRAHAWLVSGGTVLLGGSEAELARYSELTTLGSDVS